MATDWLKVCKDTPDKPELAIVARELGLSLAETFLQWFRLYAWADGMTHTGRLENLSLDDGDTLAHCAHGLCSSLSGGKVGWIKPLGGDFANGFYFANWDRHNGKSSKARALETEKKRRQRKSVSRRKRDKIGTRRDVTLRERTPSVRPFVATDHFETWPDARRLANENARRLWPARRSLPKHEDQELLLKAAFLARTVFSEHWLADAVEGTVRKSPRNPAAYLKTILAETARKSGHELNALFDAVEIPAKPSNGKASGDRSPPEVPAIGAMPEERP